MNKYVTERVSRGWSVTSTAIMLAAVTILWMVLAALYWTLRPSIHLGAHDAWVPLLLLLAWVAMFFGVAGCWLRLLNLSVFVRDLAHLMTHDGLTGAMRRSSFYDAAKNALTGSTQPWLLTYLDLDQFKLINDSLGHSIGDKVLLEFVCWLKDAVPADSLIGRLGGDEFAVLSRVDAPLTVGNLQALLAESLTSIGDTPLVVEGTSLHVTVSCGFSRFPEDADDIESLITYGDAAMYHSKEGGRNQSREFRPQMVESMRNRIDIVNDLRNAVVDGHLTLFYQPIILLDTGKVCGAEALLRWDHPRLGNLTPDRFLPLVLEPHLLIQLDNWVIQTAIRESARWHELSPSPPVLSINVSPVHFQRGDVLRAITAALDQHNVLPRQVIIEITESMLMTLEPRTEEQLQSLRDAGVRIAIDDFGSGYANVGYLSQLSAQVIKIDRSFIAGIEADRTSPVIVQHLIGMAHDLGLEVVAEGVETAAQQALLAASGADFAQGYLFSHPLPAIEFVRFWQAQAQVAAAAQRSKNTVEEALQ